MEIQTYIPGQLKGLVNMIWEQKAEIHNGWQILPSGFVELVFMLGPAMDEVKGKLIDDAFNPTTNFCFLSGLHTKPLTIKCGLFHTFGIQMHPICVKAIFGIPSVEVRDWAVEGKYLMSGMAEIEDQLLAENTFLSKAKWLENYFVKKIREHSDLITALKIRRVIQRARQKIVEDKRLKIEDLTGYSRMHTHQLFKEWFGLAPGRALRLSQFTYSLELLQNRSLRLTETAFQSGFYDQSHFIRVFYEFADMTPGDYRKRMIPIVGQIPV